ncbi:hypothetical protein GLN3_17345 (plasmid) [Geobacillus lituanicus]|nr:hypothetical protein GLN3_17160 [Geobacillus lituanicus]ASS88861.1 hypothetical protein GLN3_17345 [Geobacillus lituanicus]
MKKLFLPALALGVLGILGSPFESGDILMLLESAGYKAPAWVGQSLTTISSVYGVQHFLIGALGVTVPVWLAAAIAAAGAAGL